MKRDSLPQQDSRIAFEKLSDETKAEMRSATEAGQPLLRFRFFFLSWKGALDFDWHFMQADVGRWLGRCSCKSSTSWLRASLQV